jgi:hypothetical protein
VQVLPSVSLPSVSVPRQKQRGAALSAGRGRERRMQRLRAAREWRLGCEDPGRAAAASTGASAASCACLLPRRAGGGIGDPGGELFAVFNALSAGRVAWCKQPDAYDRIIIGNRWGPRRGPAAGAEGAGPSARGAGAAASGAPAPRRARAAAAFASHSPRPPRRAPPSGPPPREYDFVAGKDAWLDRMAGYFPRDTQVGGGGSQGIELGVEGAEDQGRQAGACMAPAANEAGKGAPACPGPLCPGSNLAPPPRPPPARRSRGSWRCSLKSPRRRRAYVAGPTGRRARPWAQQQSPATRRTQPLGRPGLTRSRTERTRFRPPACPPARPPARPARPAARSR